MAMIHGSSWRFLAMTFFPFGAGGGRLPCRHCGRRGVGRQLLTKDMRRQRPWAARLSVGLSLGLVVTLSTLPSLGMSQLDDERPPGSTAATTTAATTTAAAASHRDTIVRLLHGGDATGVIQYMRTVLDREDESGGSGAGGVEDGGEAVFRDGLTPPLYHYAGLAFHLLGDLESAEVT